MPESQKKEEKNPVENVIESTYEGEKDMLMNEYANDSVFEPYRVDKIKKVKKALAKRFKNSLSQFKVQFSLKKFLLK